MGKKDNTPTYSEVDTAIKVLNWLSDEIKNKSFDGWGINNQMLQGACSCLANLKDNIYGERLKD